MIFLRSKVARRVFLLFIVSSLVPVLLLVILSFGQVSSFIKNQQSEQVKQLNKDYGLALLERLLLLKMQLGWISEAINQEKLSIDSLGEKGFYLKDNQGFKKIELITDVEKYISRLRDEKIAKYLKKENKYFKLGDYILITDHQPHSFLRVYLVRILDPQHPENGLLVGEIDQSFLWGVFNSFGPKIQLCVLNELNRVLFCSHEEYLPGLGQLIEMNQSSSGQFAWQGINNKYLINYWSIFLEPNFSIPKWTLIVIQSKEDVLTILADFRNIFIVVITLTIAIVALLSAYQIRRNLIPIEKIIEGIECIANKNFDRPVMVNSGDEFEELATSFNKMGVIINKQLQTLSAMADIDRLILSTMKIEDIVRIVLTCMNDIVSQDYISMVVIKSNHNNACYIYTRNELAKEMITVDTQEITSLEYQRLLANQNYIYVCDYQQNIPGYLLSLQKLGAVSFLILPIVLKEEVSAIICLGYRSLLTVSEEYIFLSRDFANRVAVALSKASWEEQLYHMAHYDSLTGIPNRLLLKDRLQQSLARAERQNSFIAVLFIDLDRFKYVNDSLGHVIGDLLLCEVAQRLSRNLRSEDTISRLGGDEFVIVISQFENIKEPLSITTKIANKILAEFSMPFNINDREIFSTASIGIACYPSDGQATDELIKNSDSAMYHAKSKGKNNYQFYSKILNDVALERLEMENNLRYALERGEFELYYQPKVETRSKRICGAEALLRWNHPQKGRVSPGQFIPLCEEVGLIIPISEWIIHTACMQAKHWQDRGFLSLTVAVNLSPLQFRQPDLIQKVKNILDEIGMTANRLEFEITESTAMEDIDEAIATMDIFKRMGIFFSIDDFGTGYSSLSYLKRFPVNTLKIDQSFIRNIHVNFEDAAIVKSIVTLAHSLKFAVIAEGVETKEQFDFLKDIDCDEIQGYLFSPPVSVDEFTNLLSHNKFDN